MVSSKYPHVIVNYGVASIPRSDMCLLSLHGNPVVCMILHSIINTLVARIDQSITLENNVQVGSLWRT